MIYYMKHVIESYYTVHKCRAKDALYTGSIKVLPEYRECRGNMETYVQSMRSLHTAGSVDRDPNSVLGIIREMFDVSLFKSPTVLLICASGFLSFTGEF
jgi:hypothetical protein